MCFDSRPYASSGMLRDRVSVSCHKGYEHRGVASVLLSGLTLCAHAHGQLCAAWSGPYMLAVVTKEDDTPTGAPAFAMLTRT